jgi:hypothetical protein
MAAGANQAQDFLQTVHLQNLFGAYHVIQILYYHLEMVVEEQRQMQHQTAAVYQPVVDLVVVVVVDVTAGAEAAVIVAAQVAEEVQDLLILEQINQTHRV